MFSQTNKTKWIPVTIAAIVIGAGAVGFCLMNGKNNAGGKDFSGWKTYKNGEYGFELRYPAELAGKENIMNPGDGTQGGIGFALFKSVDPNDGKAEAMAFGADKFIPNPDKSATSKLLIKDECEVPAAYYSDKDKKLSDKNISGVNFTRIETGYDGASKGDVVTHYIGYVGKSNDICYRFLLYYAKDDDATKQSDINLFEKIISTVTFAAP